MTEELHRAGFVCIAGLPNAGKSTLLNALTGEKLAITAHQAQTTRTSIRGALTMPGAQIIFTDTPGIHESGTVFDRRMMESVRDALEHCDLVLYVADATKTPKEEDDRAVRLLRKSAPVLLVLNKIDRLSEKAVLLPLIERYMQLFHFADVVPVSARTGAGVEEVKRAIRERLPEGPPLYPDDYLTDQPMRFMAAEIIREQILRAARSEVPHAAGVIIDNWEDTARLTKIAATIQVEREGQKAILIGNKGQMMKKIGSDARRELERLLGHKVFLSVFVKVTPNWRADPAHLNALDWRSMIGSEDK